MTPSNGDNIYLPKIALLDRIVEEIAIETTAPRNEDFRTSAEYGRLCRVASDALKKAIAT